MDIRRRTLLSKIPRKGPINIYNYLTIEALEDGLTASLSVNTCEYCVDSDGNWKNLSAGTATESINSGHTLSFRGNLTSNNSNGIGTFTISKKCNLRGNCMSMLFGDNASNNTSVPAYAFKSLFKGCTTIVKVSKTFLPATTIGRNGYDSMFNGCTSLIAAPDLPAASMTYLCYTAMFYNCTSLVNAPALSATTLYDSCYMSMFQGCINLLNAPELPATSLARYCYYSMFRGCTKLVNPPIMNATTVAEYSCHCMFHTCSSLIASPNLPATSLAGHCYDSMFYYCSKLLEVPNLPAKVLQAQCYRAMFQGCSSIKEAYLPATSLAAECYFSMFQDCVKLQKAVILATQLTANSNCCSQMFFNCYSFNYIKALFLNAPGPQTTFNWVYRVASTGTFVKNHDATWDIQGAHGVPEGWTVVNDGEESGGQFYINHDGFGDGTITFTIDSPKTWNECVGLKDDTGVYEITYDEVVPGVYRFMINNYKYSYAIEADEDDNTPIPEDLIKIGTTYYAHEI